MESKGVLEIATKMFILVDVYAEKRPEIHHRFPFGVKEEVYVLPVRFDRQFV